ncbi:MAG TPA: OpgC domain-containing protein [Terriglobales bacterium]|jgi:hypothetical protein|nr:OpgC domain-containing protein [Terriglobales bacterium]
MKNRIEELDALRGVMLVWMTCTHLPTILSTYLNQPVGYFAATEGFIFLSALFTGRICFRVLQREGNRGMCRNLWIRAGRLYIYQLLLLACAFVIEAPIAARGNRPAVHNLLNYFFTVGRPRAFIDAALMFYRPPLLDILPIYIIFLALTPFAVLLGVRFGWKYVVAGGFVLWLFAQFGLKAMVYNWLTHAFGLRVPLNEMGAFDLWAWQLWWLMGLWLGVHWAESDLDLDRLAKKSQVLVPAMVIAFCFLTLRYVQIATDLDFGKYAPLFDKWNFGVARMVDFSAVAAISIRFRSILKPLAIRPLVMLGQASLPVFCVHLLCVFFALTIMGNKAMLTGWVAAVVVVTSFSALLLTAVIANRRAIKMRTSAARLNVPAAKQLD